MISLHIPELMPDEFILGYLGRIGKLNGVQSERELRAVLRQLYKPKNKSESEVTLIENLAIASEIDTCHFARHHTLIPAYRAVSSHLNEHQHGDPGDFGLLSAHAPRLMREDIQLCEECLKEDMDYLGFTFWRRSHQLHGIDWCLKHATPLLSVDPKVGFFKQPDMAIKLASPKENLEEVESNPVVRRYMQLMQMILDFSKPISPMAIAPLLCGKAKGINLQTSRNGTKPILSELAVNQLPGVWVRRHFNGLLNKPPHQFKHEYDGVCATAGKAHASTSYLLATAVMCVTSEECEQLWWNAANRHIAGDKKSGSPAKISIRRIKSAYVETRGDIKSMAELMKCNNKSLSVKMGNLGLPSLVAAHRSSIEAVLDFYQKRATLQEIINRPNVHINCVSELLRTLAPQHSNLISDILWHSQRTAQSH